MARLEEIDKDLDKSGVVLAKDIDDCSNCPLYESECYGCTSDGAGNPIEPPCTSWNGDDEIWDGMLEHQRLEWEEYEERQKKRERSMKAKKAAETRKRYAHLDEYIFEKIEDPSDIRTIEMTTLQWVEEKCHVKKTYVSVNGGVSIHRKRPITLEIYVTGLTVALTSVLKVCALNGVRTVLMHYNSVTGEYVEQEMFWRQRPWLISKV